MSKTPLMVEVLSGREVIGRLMPAEFRAAAAVPSRMFLEPAIESFNAWKTRIGEPERVRLQLVKE